VVHLADVGTSDLPALLADVVNKQTLADYTLLRPASRRLCGRLEIGDFRHAKVLALSAFLQLEEVAGNAEITAGTIGETAETLTLLTGARLFAARAPPVAQAVRPAFGMGFPRGSRGPLIVSRALFERSGISFRMVHDVGVAAVDPRAAARNPGV
jgi:hypothetical protein